MTLREKLIVSRNKAGLSQMELAERLGVSRQAVSRWESGDTTPTMDKLKALAKDLRRIAGLAVQRCRGSKLPKQQNRKQTGPGRCPAGKEGEKNRKSGPIAIALTIVVIALSAYGLQRKTKKADEADDQR